MKKWRITKRAKFALVAAGLIVIGFSSYCLSTPLTGNRWQIEKKIQHDVPLGSPIFAVAAYLAFKHIDFQYLDGGRGGWALDRSSSLASSCPGWPVVGYPPKQNEVRTVIEATFRDKDNGGILTVDFYFDKSYKLAAYDPSIGSIDILCMNNGQPAFYLCDSETGTGEKRAAG